MLVFCTIKSTYQRYPQGICLPSFVVEYFSGLFAHPSIKSLTYLFMRRKFIFYSKTMKTIQAKFAKFGGHIMVLVCYVILQDHVAKESKDFMGRQTSR